MEFKKIKIISLILIFFLIFNILFANDLSTDVFSENTKGDLIIPSNTVLHVVALGTKIYNIEFQRTSGGYVFSNIGPSEVEDVLNFLYDNNVEVSRGKIEYKTSSNNYYLEQRNVNDPIYDIVEKGRFFDRTVGTISGDYINEQTSSLDYDLNQVSGSINYEYTTQTPGTIDLIGENSYSVNEAYNKFYINGIEVSREIFFEFKNRVGGVMPITEEFITYAINHYSENPQSSPENNVPTSNNIRYDDYGYPTSQTSNLNNDIRTQDLDHKKIDEALKVYRERGISSVDSNQITDPNIEFAYELARNQVPLVAMGYIDDPLSVSAEERTLFSKYVTPSAQGYSTTINTLNTNIDELKQKQDELKECETDECKKNANEEIKKLNDDIEFGNKLLQNIPDEKLHDTISGLNSAEMEHFLELQQKKECGDGFLSSLCMAFNFNNENTYLSQSMYNQLNNIDSKLDMDAYNKEVFNLLANNINGITYNNNEFNYNGQSYTSVDELKTALENEKKTCEGDRCQEINRMLAVVEPAYKREKVEVNFLYTLIGALRNPDQGGLKAAKLFGFEADYSNLPKWLGESMASQMCIGKIEGYLDKTIITPGIATKYGCTKYNDSQPNQKCLEVIADIRAQRTPILPNNNTIISLSYYLRAPIDGDVKYIVAMSYQQNGNIKKVLLINETQLGKEQIVNKFDNIEISLNNTQGIVENSFKIAIAAFYENNNLYEKIATTLVLASVDTITTSIINNGNEDGNNAANSADDDDGLSVQSLLDMIEI